MKYKETVKVIIIVLVVFLSFMVLHNIIGTSMFEHSSWDTYDLQAEAWINGRNYLDHDYPHLELAIYKDNYYVSFPPFPFVFLCILISTKKDSRRGSLWNRLFRRI